jgi:predicted metal-dependent hydrolase
VNREYFNGKIQQPHLVWNNRVTKRKFGHYQWDTDTVMVSRSLDDPRVPEFVVDFVIYHELLHKKRGSVLVNQRRVVHSKSFREEESCFARYSEAQEYLNKLSQKKY